MRTEWAKSLVDDNASLEDFNIAMDSAFTFGGKICLDTSETVSVLKLETDLKNEGEFLYLLTRNKKIIKIGKGKEGLSNRFTSYKCGHYVQGAKTRNGTLHPKTTCSLTNGFIYHTIEKDLLEDEDNIWEFYCYNLPKKQITVEIFGETETINCVLADGYERVAMERFIAIYGKKPQLSFNSETKKGRKRKRDIMI